MTTCAFCAILAGDREAHVLYEDEKTAAFLDRNPATEGHTLIVPRQHQTFLFTEEAAIATAIFRTLRRVAMAINQTLEPDGVSLFYTSAELVGEVTHAHVHLVPRYVDDDIHLSLSRHALDEQSAGRLAAEIREKL